MTERSSTRRFSRQIHSSERSLDRVLPDLSQFLSERPVDDSIVYIVQLAVEELVLNVIKHGYHDEAGRTIALELEVERNSAVIVVEDDGEPFDPRSAPEPDFHAIAGGEQLGGLGLHLVRSLAASFDYERVDSRNRVRVMVRPLVVPPS